MSTTSTAPVAAEDVPSELVEVPGRGRSVPAITRMLERAGVVLDPDFGPLALPRGSVLYRARAVPERVRRALAGAATFKANPRAKERT